MEQSATEKLKEILAKVRENPQSDLAELLAEDLTDNFDEGEYMLLALSGVIFSKELHWQDQAKLLVFHEGDLGVPYMAHLLKTQHEWKLKSFTSQCLCCFGEGTMATNEPPYHEPCNCCGGKGWGSVAF